ncbi:MAG: FliM/FliN family flagellar motor C-terminal domain-containing protein [Terracidiphilus sp.]|jgi:flagellar motor switch protein FliM
MPAQAASQQAAHQPSLPGATDAPAENALIPSQPDDEDLIPLGLPVSRLPVELEVSVPVREFRVRHLLTLGSGQVIETQWAHDEDMPLSAGEVQLAWSEFEVVDSHLAVRLTRLA